MFNKKGMASNDWVKEMNGSQICEGRLPVAHHQVTSAQVWSPVNRSRALSMSMFTRKVFTCRFLTCNLFTCTQVRAMIGAQIVFKVV